MPIYDQSYRHYGGERLARGRAWAVIARAGLRAFFRKRAFLGLMLLSWMPFLIRAVQIYAAANLPQASFLALTPRTFRQFLGQQDIFVFFVTVYVGAGLIANDRRANALQIYLAKPLGRAEYVVGKLAILMTFLLMVTWVPAIVLLMVQVAFTGSFTFFRANLFLFPAITTFCFLEAIVGGVSMLALSSLSNNSRYVGMLYAALIFFSQAIFVVLKAATGDVWWSWLSLPNDVIGVGDAIFRQSSGLSTQWPAELAAIAALLIVSGVILERRVRGVEVVA
jgi:ABC-type transport system involved in multi-copper enzyme maturation permease subunit